MLTEEQIKQALHARRVVPLAVPNPHGPLGLEQLAEAAARLQETAPAGAPDREERPLALRPDTWEKLEEWARTASPSSGPPLTATDLAAAILEEAIKGR
jgi:hypothetical protein